MSRVLERAHGRGVEPRFGWSQNHQAADRPDIRLGELQHACEPAALDPNCHQPEPDLIQMHFATGRVRELGAGPTVATSIGADHLPLNVIRLKDDWIPISEFPDKLTPSPRRSLEGLRSGWDDIACRPAVLQRSTPCQTAQIHLQTSAGNDRPDAATDALDIGDHPFMAGGSGPRFDDPPHDAAPFDGTMSPTRRRQSDTDYPAARSRRRPCPAQPIGGD